MKHSTPRPCARCDLSTGVIVQRDNGIWNHATPMMCIAELKLALAYHTRASITDEGRAALGAEVVDG